jgi:hypothetical protein
MKRNLSVLVFFGLILLSAGTLVWAHEDSPSLPPPAQQPQMQQAAQQMWSPQELNNLVAPIALYPDPLLGQLLVASTYPLEVVEANQWLQLNKNLGARELMDAAKQQPWDPSVQALVAVPDALAMLNHDIRWTTDLGNAFLAQQADVMNAVQQKRAQAQDNGKLSSTPQQTVTTEDQGGQQAIVIQPANPQIIYVPYYDPLYVWGPPVYGYYPPLFYSGLGFGFGRGFNLSFYFDDWGGWGGWGWGPSWFGRSVFVNNSFFPRYGFYRGFRGGSGERTIWAHDPGHRLGVPYRNHQVSARFERASIASRNSFRASAGSRVAAAPYTNGSAGRFAGRTGEQGYRNMAPQQHRSASPQGQRLQSQPQQRNQAPQQYRSASPQGQRFQSQPQQRNQAPQQYRSAPQMSASRFSGGGSSSGRHNSNGGGGHRR